MGHGKQGGFSLLETTVASALLLPVMITVLNASVAVGEAIDENEHAAKVVTTARTTAQRIGHLLMPAVPSTIEVGPAWTKEHGPMRSGMGGGAPAGQKLPDQQPAVGEDGIPTKVEKRDYEWSPIAQRASVASLRFQAASGVVSMNASDRSPEQRLVFVMDGRETQNGIDDDGDGLVDEGDLVLVSNAVPTVVASSVEECSFRLDGRVMEFSIRCAQRDGRGSITRATIRKRVFLRNV